jgi:hypothetical protein
MDPSIHPSMCVCVLFVVCIRNVYKGTSTTNRGIFILILYEPSCGHNPTQSLFPSLEALKDM